MSKKIVKLRSGPKKGHGGYSFLSRGELPENRQYIERYLTGVREGLIQNLGPTEDDLTAAQAVLIDRIVTKLGILRCIEEYIRENTVMKGENLAPSLGNLYLSYNNCIRHDLQVLGIDKRVIAPGPTLEEITAEIIAKRKKKE